MPKINESLVNKASLFLKVISDTTRLRICLALFNSKKNVGNIALELNMSLSSISHQLRILKQANICRSVKKGKEQFYELSDDHVKNLIMLSFEHMEE